MNEILRPVDAGDETNITNMFPDTGEEHWEDVDDVIPDEDDTFVYETTVDDNYYRDLYELSDFSDIGAIKNVTVHARCRAVVSPTRDSLKIALRTGGAVFESNEIRLTTSYLDYSYSWLLNPSTGLPWTIAELNNLQAGIALRNARMPPSMAASLCTQVYVVITYVYQAIAKCQIAFDSDPLDPDPDWTDVSADLKEIHTQRGRQHELDRIESGLCTFVLDNSSGDYSPLNVVYDIRLTKKVNLYVDLGGGITEDIYTGYVEAWTPTYLCQQAIGEFIRVDCADNLKLLSKVPITHAGYPSEISGLRVPRVLNYQGFPAGDRDINAGQETLQATGALSKVNALTHLEDVQKSEGSLFLMGRNGYALYQDRAYRPAQPVAMTLGPDDVLFIEPRLSLDDELLWNEIIGNCIGGSEQTVSHPDSITDHGLRTFSREDLLLTTDAAVLLVLLRLLARYYEASLRVKSVTLMPQIEGTLPPEIFAREISDRIHLDMPQEFIDAEYFIEGIAIDYVENIWAVRWQLSDATSQDFEPEEANLTLRPNGVGAETALLRFPNTGEENWQDVDEVISDEDGTYVYWDTGSSSARDLYGIEDSGNPLGIINYVRVYVRARDLGNVGSNYARSVLKSGATIDESGSYTLTTSFVNYYKEYALNPNTGKKWTWADINALQAGVWLFCHLVGEAPRCTQVYVVVNYWSMYG